MNRGYVNLSAPTPKKPKRPKRVLLAVIVCFIVLGGVAYATYRAARPLPAASITLNVNDITAQPVTNDWTASGESAIGLGSGGILALGPHADTVVPTASIAKVITILTVLDKYPLEPGQPGPTLTLTDKDVALQASAKAKGGATVSVTNGEQISEYAVVQAMLLPSANNMADSLATWAYGSMDAYRAAAQKYVSEHGLDYTTVGSDASGLSPSTTSTARNLVTLGQLAYDEPVIREIALQTTALIPGVGSVYTTNDALGQDGITGLKTGTSDEAGDCFLFSADHTFANGTKKSFIGVVLNAGSDSARFSDARVLLEQTYNNFVDRKVAVEGQTVGTITTAWGATSPVILAADLSTVTWKGDPITVKNQVASPGTDVKAGQSVGQLTANDGSARLIAKNTITPPTLWWRISH